MGSIWLGAFVGFLVVLVLGFLFPGIGHLLGGFIGGIVAGLIAKGAGRWINCRLLSRHIRRYHNCNSGNRRTSNSWRSRNWFRRCIIWRISGFSNRCSSDYTCDICRNYFGNRRFNWWSNCKVNCPPFICLT